MSDAKKTDETFRWWILAIWFAGATLLLWGAASNSVARVLAGAACWGMAAAMVAGAKN